MILFFLNLAPIQPHNSVNPLSQDLNAMRQTLLFGGLESLAYNINRKVSDVMLYEFGKTYNRYGDDFVEEQRLARFR